MNGRDWMTKHGVTAQLHFSPNEHGLLGVWTMLVTPADVGLAIPMLANERLDRDPGDVIETLALGYQHGRSQMMNDWLAGMNEAIADLATIKSIDSEGKAS